MCECLKMAGYGPDSFGKHHHIECSKYATEKFPYLMYYEEAEDAWVFAPDKVENIISTDSLDCSDTIEIQFKRVDFTDSEVDNIPEE